MSNKAKYDTDVEKGQMVVKRVVTYENQNLQNNNKQLQKQISQLSEQLSASQDELKKVQNELDETKTSKNQLNKAYKSLKSNLASVTIGKDEFELKYMTLKEKSNKVEGKLEDQLESAQTEIKTLRQDKLKQKEKNASLKEKYKSFKKECAEKDD